MDRRIFFKNNTALTDISDQVAYVKSDSYVLDFVAAEDKLYIGSNLPFNHLYFRFVTPNTSPSQASIKIWDGKAFVTVVDQVDLTEGFTKDGILKWTVSRDTSWVREAYSYDVTNLSTTEIYDLYWMELSFSADLDITTDMLYVGQKFSNDEDMYVYYPDLRQTNLMKQYSATKTNWDDQHISAAENIAVTLRSRSLIYTPDQINDYDQLRLASIHKTAEIIYSAFGKAYVDDKLEARKAYDSVMANPALVLDTNANSRVDWVDRKASSVWMSR